jgi:hypothetical protein
MSDFLTNLAGRSLGSIEVVQARVPSIFEPYRRGSGLPGAALETVARELDPEPAAETDSPADTAPLRVRHPAEKLSSRERSATVQVEHPPEDVPETQPAKAAELPDSSAVRPHSLTADALVRREPVEALATLAPRLKAVSDRPADTGDATLPRAAAPAVPHNITHPQAAAELTLTTAKAADPVSGIASPHNTFSMEETAPVSRNTPQHTVPSTNATGTVSRIGDERRGPSVITPERLSGVAPKPRPRPTEAAGEVPISSPEPDKPAARSIAGEASTVTRAAPAALPSRIRPPVAPRPSRAESSSFERPNAAIQVSIGKVEVRAVVSNPPAARPQPPKSRPSVSLDDYLNGRNRGRR